MTYAPDQSVNPLFPEVLDGPKIVIWKISGSRGCSRRTILKGSTHFRP